MERLPSNKSNGEPNANPITHALPTQLRARDDSGGDAHSAVRTRPANANSAMSPAPKPAIRDHFPYPAGYTKFSGIRTNAGKGPKYMRTLPFTIIDSCLIESTS